MQVRPSQISAVRFGDVRPARPDAAPERPAGEVDAPRERDRADVTPPPAEELSDRVANFAETIDERLKNLAAETGQDLSEVASAFSGFVERLQNGIADGSLTGSDLERGVRNALALTAANVKEALVQDTDEVTAKTNVQSPEERIDLFEQKVNERLGGIAENADPATIAQLREAQQAFAAGLDGLRAGLAEGRFDDTTLGRVVQATITSLGGGVQAALAEPIDEKLAGNTTSNDLPGVDLTPVSDLGERFDAFAEKLTERLASLDLSGPEGGAVRSTGSEFLSLLEDLSAGSTSGGLSADRAASLFQNALSNFSGDLAQLFERADGELSLYSRDAQRTV